MRVPGPRVMVGVVALWAALTGLSLNNNLQILEDQVREAALSRSRMMVMVVQTTRLWNARHGGVYVPVTPETPPNEWLVDPQRDVTIAGQAFTKVNPAYMTRQLADLINSRQGVTLRLTSRNPIRPANAPTPWEDAALLRFEAGQEEVLEQATQEGQPVFRYMARMIAEGPCLKCHAVQGYKLGDVRGGLSVTLPVAEFRAVIGPLRQQTIALHGLAFAVLTAVSLVFFARLRGNWLKLEEAKALQENIVAERTAALRTANAELYRSNAELENFAYVASHDLQEPLRMIGAYAQLVEKRYAPALDDEGREFLGYLSDGAGRMKQMIDDLLSYSRVGRLQPVFSQISLEDIVDSALNNLKKSIGESGAIIEISRPLPVVRAEIPLLIRLFQNLIGNALKYRAADVHPVVTIGAEPLADGWLISVADNGIGIADKDRERIFDVFQRLHSRTAYPGTGIGLAVARRIVERHGGRIWVDANPGGGSVFRFTLITGGEDVANTQQGQPENSKSS